MTAERLLSIPESKTLFIDIDGTLINSMYELTDQSIFGTVEAIQNIGWEIGLSSDSPMALMQSWKERLGLNGGLIAEKGALIEHNGTIISQPDLEKRFGHIGISSLHEVRSKLPEFRLWHGNPVEALMKHEPIGNPGENVILINNHRRCSYGIFVRNVDNEGCLKIIPELTDKVVNIIRPVYEDSNFEEDLNHEYGLLIVSDPSICKRLGTLAILEKTKQSNIGMIGNSEADFVGDDIALHYAVSNATQEYKKHAEYISDEVFTSGVVDIIKQSIKTSLSI